MDVLFNPRNQRQANTRNLAKAAASYAAGSLMRRVTRPPAAPRASVQQIIRAAHELKNFDLFVTGSLSNTTTPVQALLNQVDQGTGGSNRTGRQYMIEKLSLRFDFASSGVLFGDVVRVVVVVDKESRGGTAVTADLLALNGALLTQSVSQFNFDNVPSRFKVLFDRRFPVNPCASPTTTTTVPWFVPVDIELAPKQRVHCYNTTGGAQADIDSGAVYVFVYSATSTVGNPSTYTLHSRCSFRDL